MSAGTGEAKGGGTLFEEVALWIEGSVREAPLVIGIGGPGGCGKTTLTRWLADRLRGAAVLPLDDFRLPREQRAQGVFGSHPEGNDLPLLRSCLRAARAGRNFERPVFDRKSGAWADPLTMPPSRILICDGEIAAHTAVRDEFDALIVVEAHWRTQLNTRLTRDLRERACSLEKAIEVFLQSNLRDYPVHAAGATDAADLVFYRNRSGQFSLRQGVNTGPFRTR